MRVYLDAAPVIDLIEQVQPFAGFWYQAESWSVPRWVVVKAETNAQGTNRRFVVTNRAGAAQYLEATYDEYAMRGENRNKELKCGLGMD